MKTNARSPAKQHRPRRAEIVPSNCTASTPAAHIRRSSSSSIFHQHIGQTVDLAFIVVHVHQHVFKRTQCMHPFKKAEPSVFCIPRFTHAGDALCVRGERRILRQRVGRTAGAFQRAPVRQRLPVRMARHGKNARFPRNAPGVRFVLTIASVWL